MNDLEAGPRAPYRPSALARLIHSLRAGVAGALSASRDVPAAPTVEHVVEHVDYERVEQIVRSVAEEIWARKSDMSVALQEIALRDSAQFVLDQIPLHLGKTHYELRRDAILAAPDGLFMEFGVWKGAWLSEMAAIREVPFYGFDSFEGLPEPWAFHEAGQFDLGGDLPEMPENVTLVKGWFADTLPAFLEQHPQPVAFLHVDCDLYTSTKTVLDLLTPRLVPGSQIVLDDFMFTPGWQREEHRAFFDYVAAHNWQFEYTGYSSDFPACSASVQLIAQG
jgi:macrocin-O-methyltransferase TylF-like protien